MERLRCVDLPCMPSHSVGDKRDICVPHVVHVPGSSFYVLGPCSRKAHGRLCWNLHSVVLELEQISRDLTCAGHICLVHQNSSHLNSLQAQTQNRPRADPVLLLSWWLDCAQVYHCVGMCDSVSVCVGMSWCVSVCRFVWVWEVLLCGSIWRVSLGGTMSMSVCQPACERVSMCLCYWVTVCLSVCIRVCQCVSMCQHVHQCLWVLPVCVSACLCVWAVLWVCGPHVWVWTSRSVSACLSVLAHQPVCEYVCVSVCNTCLGHVVFTLLRLTSCLTELETTALLDRWPGCRLRTQENVLGFDLILITCLRGTIISCHR